MIFLSFVISFVYLCFFVQVLDFAVDLLKRFLNFSLEDHILESTYNKFFFLFYVSL
jgi:hypothetical protein